MTDFSIFEDFTSSISRTSLAVLCFTVNSGCPEPTPLFDYAWGRALFFMLAFSNVFVALVMLSVVGGFLSRLSNLSWWLSRTFRNPAAASTSFAAMQKKVLSHTSLTVLVPAYLPNEQAILGGTIRHILEKLEYDYPFVLIVCYNTPSPMPAVEAQLRALEGQAFRDGRTVRVLKVEGSCSKADNLNAALHLVDTERVVIYDADHHPDPYSLVIASAHIEYKGCACVQGSTYLRERPSLLAHYINAEFFLTHFVFFPAMEFIASFGVFGGSNALWRTADLRANEFRNDVQTEDIELSARAQLGGSVRISFCPESRSGELPPATFLALYKQRLRWALGWDQVTMQHTRHIWAASSFSCLEKFGFYWLLPLRWALLFSATLNALVTPLVVNVFHHYHPDAALGGPIETTLALSFGAYLVTSCAMLANGLMYEPPSMWLAIAAFLASGSLYIGWQLMLVCISLAKIFSKADGGWESEPLASPLAAAFSHTGGSMDNMEMADGASASESELLSWAWLPRSVVPPASSSAVGGAAVAAGSSDAGGQPSARPPAAPHEARRELL